MTGMMVAITGSHVGPSGPPPAGGGGPMSVSVAPNPCTGVMGNAGPGAPGAGLIEHAVALVSGGTAPFSYFWSWLSGVPAALWGFTDPTQPEVWWSFNGPDHKEAVYQVQVTDGLGAVAFATVTIIAN